jgi:outer membrane receptor protein involved in Fe transport
MRRSTVIFAGDSTWRESSENGAKRRSAVHRIATGLDIRRVRRGASDRRRPRGVTASARVSTSKLVNASVAYTFRGGAVTVSAWGTNLFNQYYSTGQLPLPFGTVSIDGAPRMFGATVDWKFLKATLPADALGGMNAEAFARPRATY